MSKGNKKFDLEGRLVDFAVRIIKTAESLPKTGNHIAGQLVRCGTSPASNYGETQSAESRSDFIHKMKVCLKELREIRVWLLIIEKASLMKSRRWRDQGKQRENFMIRNSLFDIRYSSFPKRRQGNLALIGLVPRQILRRRTDSAKGREANVCPTE